MVSSVVQGYGEKADLDLDKERAVLLGDFRYDIYGPQVQTFRLPAQAEGQSFSIVKLEVYSNYGHSDYTCVYRFRVHGQDASSPSVPDAPLVDRPGHGDQDD